MLHINNSELQMPLSLTIRIRLDIFYLAVGSQAWLDQRAGPVPLDKVDMAQGMYCIVYYHNPTQQLTTSTSAVVGFDMKTTPTPTPAPPITIKTE